LNITNVTQPANGSIELNDNGTPSDPSDDTLVYVPNAGFTGHDTFMYTITDSNGDTASAAVTVTVYAPPVAEDDEVHNIQMGTDVTIKVVNNDSDFDHDLNISTVNFISPDANDTNGDGYNDGLIVPGEGIWSVDSNGEVTFTPETDYTGDPTPVRYTVTDERGMVSNEAEIRVDYKQIANDDNMTGAPTGKEATVNVLKNDADLNASTVSLTSPKAQDTDGDGYSDTLVVPGEGTWKVNPDGTITFIPEDGFTGDPTPVSYEVSDNYGNTTAPATVTIDYAQQLEDDKEEVNIGETATVYILDNDDDVNASSVDLNASSVDGVGEDTDGDGDIDKVVVDGEGVWQVDDNGTLTFTPDPDFDGNPAPIKYTAKDNNGTSTAPATVTINYVLPPEDAPGAPHAVDDGVIRITSSGTTVIPILNNGDTYGVYDPSPTAPITYTQPPHGTVSIDDHGTPNDPTDDVLLYTPDPDYVGRDKFTYTIMDEYGRESTATVILSVDCSSSQRSDSGDAYGKMSMILMLLMTLWTGMYFVRKEEEEKRV